MLTLLHSEQPKLHRVLAVLSAKGLNVYGVLAVLSAIRLNDHLSGLYNFSFYANI